MNRDVVSLFPSLAIHTATGLEDSTYNFSNFGARSGYSVHSVLYGMPLRFRTNLAVENDKSATLEYRRGTETTMIQLDIHSE